MKTPVRSKTPTLLLILASLVVLATSGGPLSVRRAAPRVAAEPAASTPAKRLGPAELIDLTPAAALALVTMDRDPAEFAVQFAPESVSRDLFADGAIVAASDSSDSGDSEIRESIVQFAVRAGESYVLAIRSDAFVAETRLRGEMMLADGAEPADGARAPAAVTWMSTEPLRQDFVFRASGDGWISVAVRGRPASGALAGSFRAIYFRIPEVE